MPQLGDDDLVDPPPELLDDVEREIVGQRPADVDGVEAVGDAPGLVDADEDGQDVRLSLDGEEDDRDGSVRRSGDTRRSLRAYPTEGWASEKRGGPSGPVGPAGFARLPGLT